MCLMHEVGVLRLPLVFGRAHASITLSENGRAVATRGAVGGWPAAASEVVMRSGRHFAQFMVMVHGHIPPFMFFGVIRPDYDVEGGMNAQDVDGHCFYSTYFGERCPDVIHWEGMQAARKQGDRIAMLLDLDQGSMPVYKNEVLMGVVQAEGLSVEYCWAILVGVGSSVIESAPAPPSPTDEELTAAKEFARAEARLRRREELGLPLTATDAECEAAEGAHFEAEAGMPALVHEHTCLVSLQTCTMQYDAPKVHCECLRR